MPQNSKNHSQKGFGRKLLTGKKERAILVV